MTRGLDGGASLLLGARLEPAPEQDQSDDDHRRLEVQVLREPPRLGKAWPERDEGAVAVGDTGADGNQRVHVRAAVARRRPGC